LTGRSQILTPCCDERSRTTSPPWRSDLLLTESACELSVALSCDPSGLSIEASTSR